MFVCMFLAIASGIVAAPLMYYFFGVLGLLAVPFISSAIVTVFVVVALLKPEFPRILAHYLRTLSGTSPQ